MDIQKYLPPGSNPGDLAHMDETEIGRILKHAVNVEIERIRAKPPQIDTTDSRLDFRHDLGEIKGLGFLDKLRQEAIKHVTGG